MVGTDNRQHARLLFAGKKETAGQIYFDFIAFAGIMPSVDFW